MFSRLTLSLAAALLAASTFAADQANSAKTDENDPRKAVIADGGSTDSIEYTDEKQCHVKIGGSDQISPVIPMLVAAHSMQPKNQTAIRVAIDTSLRQGCDISEVDLSGLQPLNAAILFADPVMVKFLLEKGADPYLTIQRPDSKSINGLNSFDFIEVVKKKWEERGNKQALEDYSQIKKYLDQVR